MKRIFAALALLAAGATHAGDFPTGFEVAYQAVALADMSTTLDIKHHRETCELWQGATVCGGGISEANPFLGRYPSDGHVIAFFAAGGVAHALVTHELVEHHASPLVVKGWELVTIGFESGLVASNLKLGLHFSF